jgi:hypothetical protein
MEPAEPKQVIQVAKIPRPEAKPMRLLATLCFFYPQYTLASARKLPYKHVVLLIQEAQRQQAADYYNMVQIVSAPHTEKAAGVKKLSDHFKKLANS